MIWKIPRGSLDSCIYVMFSTFNTSAYKNNFYIIIFTRWLQLICIFLSKLCSKYTLKLIERQESLKNRKNPRNAYKICYITLQKCKFSNLIFIFLLREIMFFVFSTQYIIQTDFKTKQKILLGYFSQTADEYKCGHWPNVHLTKIKVF